MLTKKRNFQPNWVLPVTGIVKKRQIQKGLLTMRSPAKRIKSAAATALASLPNTASFEEKSKGMIDRIIEIDWLDRKNVSSISLSLIKS